MDLLHYAQSAVKRICKLDVLSTFYVIWLHAILLS